MNLQIAKWDRRYAEDGPSPLAPPSAPLPDTVTNVTPGQALDLACGTGRHAVWLANRGWRVDAVDGSPVAIGQLTHHAEQARCSDRVTPTLADLETEPSVFTIANGRYDLIVDCYFLHRPLFKAIRRGVRRGGLFVAVLHLRSPTATDGQRYALERGELETMVTSWRWEIVHSREQDSQDESTAANGHDLGVAEIVARRP